MNKRLYRKESNRVLGGVCAGLGDYLGIDPLFIRIFFVVWTIVGELSVLIYMVLWLIIPRSEDEQAFRAENLGARFYQLAQEVREVVHEPSAQLITFAGAGLIGWGIYSLLERLTNFPWVLREYTWFLWPALLILAGVIVLGKTMWKNK